MGVDFVILKLHIPILVMVITAFKVVLHETMN